MATTDTSIYGNLLRPAPSLMDNVNALDAADLQRTQLAGAKANLIGQQQSLADQQAVRALYQRPNFDPLKNDADMQAFSAASPTQALAMRKAALDNASTQAEIGLKTAQTTKATKESAGLDFDQSLKRTNQHLQQLVTVGDVPGAVTWIGDAVKSGELPAPQAQQVIAALQSGQITLQDWKQKAMTGGLSLLDQRRTAQEAANAAEAARHNQATEANTVRGQNMVDSRTRQGQVFENKRAGLDANGNFTGFDVPGAAPSVPAQATGIPTTPGGGPPLPAAAKPTGQPSAIQGLVDGIGQYGVSESTALSRTPPAMKAAILSQVRAQYPDYDPGTYAERQASNRAFSANGKNGQAVKSFNVGLAHLDTLANLVDKLDNGSIPVLNAAGNYIAKQSGNDAQTNFAAGKNIVMDEVVKSIVGGGGGVADREKAQETINAAQTPKQLKGAIKTVQELMGGQLVGLEQSYRAGTGKKDFRDKYLSPEAKRAFDALQQTPNSTPSGNALPPDIQAIYDKHKVR